MRLMVKITTGFTSITCDSWFAVRSSAAWEAPRFSSKEIASRAREMSPSISASSFSSSSVKKPVSPEYRISTAVGLPFSLSGRAADER